MRSDDIELDSEVVYEELDEVLTSKSFASSKQCRAMLKYVVDRTLDGNDTLLRERMIGSNVFGRTPDYDTGNDPIVRARAAEVRKRLAQHYLNFESTSRVIRIEIPTGSYRATFAPIVRARTVPSIAPLKSEVLPAIAPRFRRRRLFLWKRMTALFGLVMVAASAFWLFESWRQNHNQSAFKSFWAPVLTNGKPCVVYMGSNYTYLLSRTVLDRYRAQHPGLEDAGQEFFINLTKGQAIDESDLVPTNRYIGFGDVAAAARIISTLTHLNKKYDLRYGKEMIVTDLQDSPAFLIGGFSNPWTLHVTNSLRYSLKRGDRIVDQRNPDKAWIRSSNPDGYRQDDYAIVSRLPRADTGNFVVAIAGIATSSNQAAADFISDPNQIGSLMSKAPAGWEHKNLQIVLHTSVLNDVPLSTDVNAMHVW